MPMTCSINASGIYAIRNTKNDLCYIGSAVNLQQRAYEHLSYLRRRKHHNRHLQRAWNKYGEDCFWFESLILTVKYQLLDFEQVLMDKVGIDRLYNQRPTAGSNLGFRFSDEQRKTLSKSHLGQGGERAGNSKLTWSDVDEIKNDLDQGMSYTAIAKQYGIDRTSISNIAGGKTWLEEYRAGNSKTV